MSFVVQRAAAGGGLALSHFHGDMLRIGRGTNAELRSENPAVALEHAVITRDESGYSITDRGSITGTYVNGRSVESSPLKRGDTIDIGDLRMNVEAADPAKPMFLRVNTSTVVGPAPEKKRERAPVAIPGAGELKAQKVDFADAYRLRRPYLTKLSLIALLLIFILGIVGEIIKGGENQVVFMPGGVSSAHSREKDGCGRPIARQCAACHEPWSGAADTKCVVCHTKAPHSEVQIAAPKCTDCHQEHRGAATLTSIGDDRCVSCHADLSAHRSRATLPAPDDHITSFESHPDFPVRTDPDTLHFSHKQHLDPAGVFNGTGHREKLACPSCHRLVESKGRSDPAPITFEAHCHRCHDLKFDSRFPDVEVPHGVDSDVVYGVVLATYAGNRDILGKSPVEVRRILTQHPPPPPDQQAFLHAEQKIKTSCLQCHDTRSGKLAMVRPVIATHWLVHAEFNHLQHSNLGCESCHGAARTSEKTSDVLLPGKSSCIDCHGARGASRVSSRCLTCHHYHEGLRKASLPPCRPVAAAMVGGNGARMIEPILLIAIAILMLVIAIPVGIFIYQRLTANAPKVPTVKEMKASAEGPTAKIPATPAGGTPQPPTPAGGVTRVIEPGDVPGGAAPDAGEGTAMVQWYGMLRCTQGPLEGQTFIIEEEGIYIGRDPKLSQVVVNDSRISKRHVRIVPRNGRVMAIDQDSTNGTFLGKAGGQRVTEVELKRGDVIVLADNAATFQYQI